jgi:predicted  nucleic acid-binding Zn-ribbon protein
MPNEKSMVQCIECGTPMTASEDKDGNQYVMGTSECPECGCEDFETIESEDIEKS